MKIMCCDLNISTHCIHQKKNWIDCLNFMKIFSINYVTCLGKKELFYIFVLRNDACWPDSEGETPKWPLLIHRTRKRETVRSQHTISVNMANNSCQQNYAMFSYIHVQLAHSISPAIAQCHHSGLWEWKREEKRDRERKCTRNESTKKMIVSLNAICIRLFVNALPAVTFLRRFMFI